MAKANARIFWNWKFVPLKERINPDHFPMTKAYVESMCDLRLPISMNVAEAVDLGERINKALESVTV